MANYTPTLTHKERRERKETIILYNSVHPEISVKKLAELFDLTTSHIFDILKEAKGATYKERRKRPPKGCSKKLASAHYSMIDRCYNPDNHNYKNYGGRGITVCDRWLGKEGLINFCHDVGEPPEKNLTLDRRNNELGYSSDNCQWATYLEQRHNQRS